MGRRHYVYESVDCCFCVTGTVRWARLVPSTCPWVGTLRLTMRTVTCRSGGRSRRVVPASTALVVCGGRVVAVATAIDTCRPSATSALLVSSARGLATVQALCSVRFVGARSDGQQGQAGISFQAG